MQLFVQNISDTGGACVICSQVYKWWHIVKENLVLLVSVTQCNVLSYLQFMAKITFSQFQDFCQHIFLCA